MKPKAAVKLAVDVLMTLGLLFLMGYQFWGDFAHEWAGTGMFVLFLLHHVLNRNWHRAIFQGRYTPARVFQLVIDLLVFLSMAGLMISGVILSNYVFAALPIRGRMGFARLLHMAASLSFVFPLAGVILSRRYHQRIGLRVERQNRNPVAGAVIENILSLIHI